MATKGIDARWRSRSASKGILFHGTVETEEGENESASGPIGQPMLSSSEKHKSVSFGGTLLDVNPKKAPCVRATRSCSDPLVQDRVDPRVPDDPPADIPLRRRSSRKRRHLHVSSDEKLLIHLKSYENNQGVLSRQPSSGSRLYTEESEDSVRSDFDEISESAFEDSSRIGPYLMGAVLGHGTQGTVCKALDTRTGAFVAVKQIQLFHSEHTCSQRWTTQIAKEIQFLKGLNHPNIVRYIESLRHGQLIYIVFEYIENGSLFDILQKFGRFSEDLASIYVAQILQGLVYLHQKDVIHRDIKGANILITKDGLAKLADFGLATNTSKVSLKHTAVGTPYWIAPELASGSTEIVSASCDIWSLGATIVELITGHPPFHDMEPMVALFHLIEGSSPIPPDVSPELHSFLECCFQLEPCLRSTAAELLQHEWIQQYNHEQDPQYDDSFDSVHPEAENNLFTDALRTNRWATGKLSGRSRECVSSFPRKPPIGLVSRSSDSFNSLLRCLEEVREKEEDEDLSELSREALEAKVRDLQECSGQAVKLAQQMANDLSKLRSWEKELMAKCKTTSESLDRAKFSNQFLRESIRIFQSHLTLNDMQLARMIYDDISWRSFEQYKRGVLKVRRKVTDKLRKRCVALRDNFFFIFSFNCDDVEEPLDVHRLENIHLATKDERLPSNAFELIFRERSMVICAANETIMNGWMKALGFARMWYEEDGHRISEVSSPRKQGSSSLLRVARRLREACGVP